MLAGSGERTADSYEGDPNGAPQLHVEYTTDGVNQVPVAVDDGFTINEDTVLNGNVLEDNGSGADILGDQPSMVALGATNVSNGTLTLNPDGSFDYTPNANFNGTDTFTYTITDATPETSTAATVTITVTAVDDGTPVAVDDPDAATTPEDIPVTTIDVLLNDILVDHADISDYDTLSANGGAVSHNTGTGTFTYTPPPNFNGTDTFAYMLSDDEGDLSDPATVTVTVIGSGGGAVTEFRVSASSDDAEERESTGSMNLTSKDLDVGRRMVGIRFNGVDIPQQATILNAYVQFQVDEANSVATSFTIEGEDTDHAETYLNLGGDISSRPRTTAAVSWSPVPWTTIGEAGPDQRTPNIALVIQEIVDRPGWSSGNSLVIIIAGSGERTADSYEGDPNGAPQLHVEYSTLY